MYNAMKYIYLAGILLLLYFILTLGNVTFEEGFKMTGSPSIKNKSTIHLNKNNKNLNSILSTIKKRIKKRKMITHDDEWEKEWVI